MARLKEKKHTSYGLGILEHDKKWVFFPRMPETPVFSRVELVLLSQVLDSIVLSVGITHHLPKLNQDQLSNLNRPVTPSDIEAVI